MDPKETSIYQLYLLTLLIIVGLALFYLVFALRFRRKFRQRSQAQMESEINRLEQEKKRISQDLHDDLGPVLTAIRMKLEILNPATDKEKNVMNQAMEYIDSLALKMRKISVALMPSVLEDKGLEIAVEQYIHQYQWADNVKVEYKYEQLPKLPSHFAIHLFRVIQEIIHNTNKHAKAGKFLLHLTEEDGNIILASIDNGVGFEHTKSQEKATGYGLGNIKNRIQSLGGTINIQTGHKSGTQFYIDVPVPND